MMVGTAALTEPVAVTGCETNDDFETMENEVKEEVAVAVEIVVAVVAERATEVVVELTVAVLVVEGTETPGAELPTEELEAALEFPMLVVDNVWTEVAVVAPVVNWATLEMTMPLRLLEVVVDPDMELYVVVLEGESGKSKVLVKLNVELTWFVAVGPVVSWAPLPRVLVNEAEPPTVEEARGRVNELDKICVEDAWLAVVLDDVRDVVESTLLEGTWTKELEDPVVDTAASVVVMGPEDRETKLDEDEKPLGTEVIEDAEVTTVEVIEAVLEAVLEAERCVLLPVDDKAWDDEAAAAVALDKLDPVAEEAVVTVVNVDVREVGSGTALKVVRVAAEEVDDDFVEIGKLDDVVNSNVVLVDVAVDMIDDTEVVSCVAVDDNTAWVANDVVTSDDVDATDDEEASRLNLGDVSWSRGIRWSAVTYLSPRLNGPAVEASINKRRLK
jgi:hypothetical protein